MYGDLMLDDDLSGIVSEVERVKNSQSAPVATSNAFSISKVKEFTNSLADLWSTVETKKADIERLKYENQLAAFKAQQSYPTDDQQPIRQETVSTPQAAGFGANAKSVVLMLAVGAVVFLATRK